MKVIIDLIESIKDEIDNQGDYTFLAMLLKENDAKEMELVGEKSISRIAVAGNELIFYIDDKERTIFVEPVLTMLNDLENKEMMIPVKVSVSNQIFDIIGFGKAEKDKKFVVFITQ